MFGVDLYVFGDEKSNKSGFESIKPSYIPLLPHKCHFLGHARPGNRKKYSIWYNTMIDVDLYVFNDDKLIRSGLKPINHHVILCTTFTTFIYATFYAMRHLCHFLCHATIKKIISHYEKKSYYR